MKMIIAAYAGTGKTHFASLYPNSAIYLVCMPYKYVLTENMPCDEASKANTDNILNYNWPLNYFSAIKQNLELGKLLLIPSDLLILELLRKEKLHYCLCYPQRNAKEIYRKRYIKRGNATEFIDIFIGKWDKFMDGFENDAYGQHIVLQPDQFLSDVIELTFPSTKMEKPKTECQDLVNQNLLRDIFLW
jgi:hypothetical protein